MIQYDYKIIRDEGDEKKQYEPGEIPKNIENISYIEAPNSKGKSTLLNILAISFYGNRLDHNELAKSLRNKINSLLDSDYQEIEFQVIITQANDEPRLRATKDKNSNDILIEEYHDSEYSPISYDQFRRKYRLIYDIPDNPTERINQILLDINADLKRKVKRLNSFQAKVKSNLRSASSAKDPQKIKQLKSQNKNSKDEIEGLKKELEEKEDFCRKVKVLNHVQAYINLEKRVQKKKKSLQSLKGSKTRSEKVENRLSEALQNLLEQRKDLMDNIRDQLQKAYDELTNISKVDKKTLESWRNYDIVEEIKDYKNLSFFRDQLNNFIQIIETELREIEDDELLIEVRFYQQLKDFLSNYSDSGLDLPETKKSIKDYIKTLDNKILKGQDLVNRRQDVIYTLDCLEAIDFDISEAIKVHKRIEENEEYTDKLDEDLKTRDYEDEIEFEKEALKALEEKLAYRKKHLIKLEVDLSEIENIENKLSENKAVNSIGSLNGSQFSSRINEIEENIDSIIGQIESLKHVVEFNKIELEQLEGREEHSFSEYTNGLKDLQEKLFELIRKIENKYIEYLDQMIKGKSDRSDNEFLDFSKTVSKYIAGRMKTIRHIDKTYELQEVDLIDKKVVTTSGKTIRFDDLGTGQGQSAYIDGLLSLNDNRKILALFDEVGMMDSKSLKPIKQKIKTLYNEQKLLVGIIVQRGEEIKVTSLV